MATDARSVAIGWVSKALCAFAAVAVLAGCGSSIAPPPPAAPHSAAERTWIANAYRFIDLVESRIILTTAGGETLQSARHALSDTADIYSTLVAYTYFGACDSEIASVGNPSVRAEVVVRTLISACGRLERASSLFHLAVTRNEPALLLRAGRVSQGAEPLLDRANAQLVRLGAD